MADTARVLILGGGSGGLELACALAGRKSIEVTLVDRVGAHLWKPRLHEFAAGTIDSRLTEISFYTLAGMRGFRFEEGEVCGLDPVAKTVSLGPVEGGRGEATAPERRLSFDIGVIALGGVTADFGTPGVDEHAYSLDTRADADAFRKTLIGLMIGARARREPARIVIVGSGATGTELAANLRQAEEGVARAEGFDDRRQLLSITILEAAPEVMPGAEPDLRAKLLERLDSLAIDIVTNAQVNAVEAGGVRTESGAVYPADATMWSAGSAGLPLLERFEGVRLSRKGRIEVNDRLRLPGHPHVYALGDAASVTMSGSTGPLPPTAQVASQQASYLAKALPQVLDGREPPPFEYKEKGKIVQLARAGTVGVLNGGKNSDFLIHGQFATAAYSALERQHQMAILGPVRGILAILGDLVMPTHGPAMKLHG